MNLSDKQIPREQKEKEQLTTTEEEVKLNELRAQMLIRKLGGTDPNIKEWGFEPQTRNRDKFHRTRGLLPIGPTLKIRIREAKTAWLIALKDIEEQKRKEIKIEIKTALFHYSVRANQRKNSK